MNYDERVAIPEKLYIRFGHAARERMDMRPLDQILHEVIEHWILHGFGDEETGTAAMGFQWKALFLPHGTRARLYYKGKYYYGEVIQDDFVYAGESSSPNRMVVLVTGGRRNAWRDLSILIPGKSTWAPARLLRT
jgi:hypothetical protein